MDENVVFSVEGGHDGGGTLITIAWGPIHISFVINLETLRQIVNELLHAEGQAVDLLSRGRVD